MRPNGWITRWTTAATDASLTTQPVALVTGASSGIWNPARTRASETALPTGWVIDSGSSVLDLGEDFGQSEMLRACNA